MKNIRTLDGLLMIPLFLNIGCATSNDVIRGEWAQSIPGNSLEYQGFVLDDFGVARSVNMATLQYSTWKTDGDTLILCGESIGNHQTLNFCDTFMIKKLSKDSMILQRDNEGDEFRYKHRKNK